MKSKRTEGSFSGRQPEGVGRDSRREHPFWEAGAVPVQRVLSSFLRFPERAVLYQGNLGLGSLNQLGFSLEQQGHCVCFRFRLQSRLLVRRLVAVQCQDDGSVAVRRERFKRPERFEIGWRERVTEPLEVESDPHQFREAVERLILRSFPGSQIQSSSMACDRAHSLSGKSLRVRFATGRKGWTAVAVSPYRDQPKVNRILSDGLIWREVLRGQELHLLAMDVDSGSLRFLDRDPRDPADSRLPPAPSLLPGRKGKELDRLSRVLALAPQLIEPSLSSTSRWISFRIHGLEFARMSLEGCSGVFGIKRGRSLETMRDWQDLENLVRSLCHQRRPCPTSESPLCLLQAERWRAQGSRRYRVTPARARLLAESPLALS